MTTKDQKQAPTRGMFDLGEFHFWRDSVAVAGGGRAVMSSSQRPLLPTAGTVPAAVASRLARDLLLLPLLLPRERPAGAGAVCFAGDGGRMELMGSSSTTVAADEDAIVTLGSEVAHDPV